MLMNRIRAKAEIILKNCQKYESKNKIKIVRSVTTVEMYFI